MLQRTGKILLRKSLLVNTLIKLTTASACANHAIRNTEDKSETRKNKTRTRKKTNENAI
jgi:hypothetical protein